MKSPTSTAKEPGKNLKWVGILLVLLTNFCYMGNNYIVKWSELSASEVSLVRGTLQEKIILDTTYFYSLQTSEWIILVCWRKKSIHNYFLSRYSSSVLFFSEQGKVLITKMFLMKKKHYQEKFVSLVKVLWGRMHWNIFWSIFLVA